MKVTRWGKNLFDMLVHPIKESIDESKKEAKLNYYFQRLDTQDLVVARRIGYVEESISCGFADSCAFHYLFF